MIDPVTRTRWDENDREKELSAEANEEAYHSRWDSSCVVVPEVGEIVDCSEIIVVGTLRERLDGLLITDKDSSLDE